MAAGNLHARLFLFIIGPLSLSISPSLPLSLSLSLCMLEELRITQQLTADGMHVLVLQGYESISSAQEGSELK